MYQLRINWDVVGRSGLGGSKCFGRPIFIFLSKKIGFTPWQNIMLSQTLMYYWQEIFFWLWLQTVKPSFTDTIALFVG